MRSTVYFDDYESITENGVTRNWHDLGNGALYLTDSNGNEMELVVFTDHQGSILKLVDLEGNVEFDATYDVWGHQTINTNLLRYYHGYTAHEMIPELALINMNGRFYDPLLARFLSPDNYVQAPDNSQNFNRYSYCLNNPLKYTDPSGELFGIDDALVAFTLFNVASSMMQAAFIGGNVWKAGGQSLLSSVASYGINIATGMVGNIFGHGVGTLGTELGRAVSHGVLTGASYALQGGNFGIGVLTGFASSLAGSGAQAIGASKDLTIGLTVFAGGFTSETLGGGFLNGAFSGLSIGMLNHTWEQNGITYNDDNGLQGRLPEIICTPCKTYPLSLSTKIGLAGYNVKLLRKYWISGLSTSRKSRLVYNAKKFAQNHGYSIQTKNADIYRNKVPGALGKTSKGLGWVGSAINVYDNAADVLQTGQIGLGHGVDILSDIIPGMGIVYIGADYLYFNYSGQTIKNSLNNYYSFKLW